MRFLLLLSALLSALTGAVAPARVPASVVTASVPAAAARPVAASVAGRPKATVVHADRAEVLELAQWHLAPAAPLYLSRRRE